MRIGIIIILLSLMAVQGFTAPIAIFEPGKPAGMDVVTAEDGQWQKINAANREALALVPGTTPKSSFMYFRFDAGTRSKIESDLYIVADVFVDGIKIISSQYNSIDSTYAPSTGSVLMGNGEWQKSVFHFTKVQLKGAQNGGADFRISGGEDLKIAKIEAYTEKPDINVPSVKDTLAKYLAENPRRTDMFYTFGNDADDTSAVLYKTLGVTSIESYVTWETCERKAEGVWDWTQWDNQVKILKDADLKWVPFLILSPAYSTPGWFRASKEHVPCRCIEHGTDSKIESLWNPNLPARIERFIAEFAKRYKDSDVIESVLLGIQGDFGEAIYSVSGGGWTFDIPGEYHNHPGFWCDDPYALADFKKFISARYKTVNAVNKAWGTKYASLDAVDFPGRGEAFKAFKNEIPSGAPTVRRRWIDFIDWYRDSMTRWSDWWMMITRKHFPETPIYLCTGGDACPEHGSNFAEQCRVAAKHKAGVRITNEASHYASNFMVTRWVASAGKHYGAYFGFEPAGMEDATGIVARIYNATASGANQLHDYNPNVVGSSQTMDVQKKHFQYLFHVPNPIVPVAVWYPNVSLTLKWGGFLEKTAKMRDYTDLDFVDESMLRTGGLAHNKILAIVQGSVMEPSDASRIAKWIRDGGRAIVMDVPKFESVEGTNDPEKTLFGITPEGRVLGKGKIVRVNGWNGLASEMRKAMGDLGLPVYDLKEDGVYGTQLDEKNFMFLNVGKDSKVRIIQGTKSIDAAIPAGTITKVAF
ncbi:MAG: family 14 glycosylhydrolase [Armatimonadota bacterium]